MIMKVLYLPFNLPLDYTVQLANAITKYCEASILVFDTPQQRGEFSELSVSPRVNVIWTDKVKFPVFHPYNIKVFFKLIKKIKSENYNIIHIQECRLLNLFIVIVLKIVSNFKLVTTIHDVNFHPGEEKITTKFAKFFFERLSDVIFVHGEKLKKELEKNVKKNKIFVIPMIGHNISPMERYIEDFDDSKISDENIILFFGRIGYYKGLEYLIKASEVVKKVVPDIKVIIAGRVEKGKYDITNFNKIKKMIKNKDYFELHPYYISWKYATELFIKSKSVVLPYIEGSQTGVVPVAYRFKKPVIATDVGALSEIVENGKTGYIVPPKDFKAIADKIIKLIKNDELRLKMGKEGYKKLKDDLSPNTVASITVRVYKSINNQFL